MSVLKSRDIQIALTRNGGSLKCTYREGCSGTYSVLVKNTPRNQLTIEIVFKENGKIISSRMIDQAQAKLLWVTLNKFAEDLGWPDKKDHEIDQSITRIK
jgi:hypothetical protein